MAGLRRLLDHPCLLADDSPVCRALAGAASFLSTFLSTLAIYRAFACVGRDVDIGCADHTAVAPPLTLSSGLGMERGRLAVRLRGLCVFTIREEFQRQATRRPAGDSRRKPRTATGDGWHSRASAASSVPGASLRDAGLERRHRAGSVLGADGVRRGDGSGDDRDGRCGIGEEVWRLVPRLSRIGASRPAQSVYATPAIIRCN